MSDTYTVDGVSITPLGGGFYELKHSSIEAEGNIEKVRGKEAADQRAAEIAKAATPGPGHMDPQGDLPDTGPSDEAVKLKAAEDKAAALEAQLKEALAQRDDLMKAAEKGAETVTTIRETEGERVEGQVPGGIPTKFTGELSKEAKAALKKAGLGYTKIILEENSDIPPTGLFVGHNGRGYMIQPGEPVDVPDFILGVLDDARMSAPVVDSKSMKVLGYRERSKYPYRKVD